LCRKSENGVVKTSGKINVPLSEGNGHLVRENFRRETDKHPTHIISALRWVSGGSR
jgi:hypothetical protein